MGRPACRRDAPDRHRLRTPGKPLADLTIEDLRLLIGQRIGLPCLVPIAVEWLDHDPMAEGDMYPVT
ncbi:contact-dependent growth inhibition system immunity protein [Planotetraspora sp. GP83]|uniref:contact-dependent growth inhibition system immunity protein n=1 Tax=Planotetraspora sp. GP83 TaxID=3156264 RepID=UPI003512682D